VKIYLEDGEHLEIVVPSRLNTSVQVSLVDDEGLAMVDVVTKDGLIGAIHERCVRRHPVPPSAAPEIAAPNDHAYLSSYSGGREVGCHLCRRPRSAHKE